MADGIIRDPDAKELKDFIPIQTESGRIQTPQEKFKRTIVKHQQEAVQKFLPFAAKPLEIDYTDEIKEQADKSKKLHGHVRTQDIKVPKIDFKKYSNLKNFDVIGDGEKYDEFLSKRHSLSVYVKWTKYQFKGYSYIYTVMEDPTLSLKRARESLDPMKVQVEKGK